eukprot:CAMPEP_0113563612 /NCGR_PEP_ID=MMETSP0015_2-20120614/21164_1 /TAXON_ID=2838 /ORGANISM="Odontella" /LENGTH=74 /DNA_ID=CAMNT_0000465609 /DNA_START=521 /DNA_END=745 /DNA_ORIENTATION=+ /assembly_acc=CAM_ASM_000160
MKHASDTGQLVRRRRVADIMKAWRAKGPAMPPRKAARYLCHTLSDNVNAFDSTPEYNSDNGIVTCCTNIDLGPL